ncbi:MAG: penicillin-binding protein activator LpoB [Methylococcales bacterium]|nr:penicillin-binding protein activator LpoB [Methylococcales bacterium]MDD5754953.1 penicillin-binding protein activator LpoB [Methylococcales bacterium]
MKRSLMLVALLGISSFAQAAKIAVADLAYSERVREYFHETEYHNNESEKSHSNSYNAHSKTDYSESSGTESYMEYGELRKFVGDIKGELLKTSGFQLTQAKPYTAKGSEKVFDIIDKIKKGYYPKADYVLFGTVSELDFRDEANPIIGTNNVANTFSITLTADFSLINTHTYEIKAAFTAMGEGSDVRVASAGGRVQPSRGRVVAEVSRNLGVEVAQQVNEQLNGGSSGSRSGDYESQRAYPTTQGEPLEEDKVMRFN